MSSKAKTKGSILPIEVILSCQICYKPISEIYQGAEGDKGFNDDVEGRHNERSITKLWLTECTHLTCGEHLEGGGAPFHRDGERPKASCPICVVESNNNNKVFLYAIRGCNEQQFDLEIPKSFFNTPPITLDRSEKDFDALRFQYLSLIRFASGTFSKCRKAQTELIKTRQLIANASFENQRLQDQMKSLQEEREELKSCEEELKLWRERELKIRHYLGIFTDVVQENNYLRSYLTSIGYEVPERNFPPDSGSNGVNTVSQAKNRDTPQAEREGRITDGPSDPRNLQCFQNVSIERQMSMRSEHPIADDLSDSKFQGTKMDNHQDPMQKDYIPAIQSFGAHPASNKTQVPDMKSHPQNTMLPPAIPVHQQLRSVHRTQSMNEDFNTGYMNIEEQEEQYARLTAEVPMRNIEGVREARNPQDFNRNNTQPRQSEAPGIICCGSFDPPGYGANDSDRRAFASLSGFAPVGKVSRNHDAQICAMPALNQERHRHSVGMQQISSPLYQQLNQDYESFPDSDRLPQFQRFDYRLPQEHMAQKGFFEAQDLDTPHFTRKFQKMPGTPSPRKELQQTSAAGLNSISSPYFRPQERNLMGRRQSEASRIRRPPNSNFESSFHPTQAFENPRTPLITKSLEQYPHLKGFRSSLRDSQGLFRRPSANNIPPSPHFTKDPRFHPSQVLLTPVHPQKIHQQMRETPSLSSNIKPILDSAKYLFDNDPAVISGRSGQGSGVSSPSREWARRTQQDIIPSPRTPRINNLETLSPTRRIVRR